MLCDLKNNNKVEPAYEGNLCEHSLAKMIQRTFSENNLVKQISDKAVAYKCDLAIRFSKIKPVYKKMKSLQAQLSKATNTGARVPSTSEDILYEGRSGDAPRAQVKAIVV